MPDEKLSATTLYYKDPETGELKEDKRKESKIEYTLAKVNLTIDQLEKNVEARLAMFETLLRSNLEHACEDIEETKKSNELSNQQLIEKFKMYYNGALSNAKKEHEEVNYRLDNHDQEINGLKKRVGDLESAPTTTKAKRYEKVLWAIIGIGSGFLLTFLKNLIEALSKV